MLAFWLTVHETSLPRMQIICIVTKLVFYLLRQNIWLPCPEVQGMHNTIEEPSFSYVLGVLSDNSTAY